MKKSLQKLMCVMLSVVMILAAVPPEVFAYIAEPSGSLVLVSEDGSEQVIDTESWAETFPYGTFAFSNASVSLTENGEAQTIKVYRLGGTLGKATAYINYTPSVVNNNGERSDTNAIGENDIEVLVEDPAPDAELQKIGKDIDPFHAPDGVQLSVFETNSEEEAGAESAAAGEEADTEVSGGEEVTEASGTAAVGSETPEEPASQTQTADTNTAVSGTAEAAGVGAQTESGKTVRLSANVEAESYQWYAKSAGRWQAVEGATDAVMPIAEDDLSYVDIRLQYTADGETYCTDSWHGEIYVQGNDYYDPSEIIGTGDYDPTYSALDLTPDDDGNVCFEVVFAEGEWVKEITFTPGDNGESDPVRFATVLIYDCEGGELYDSANTLLLTLLDDEESEASVFGFDVTEAYGDICEGKVSITVKRTGGLNHTATLDYTTVDGSAVAGTDYAASSGTLWFYGDTDEQTIEIELINSHLNERGGAEVIRTPDGLTTEEKEALKDFNIVLSNLRGGEGKDTLDEEKTVAAVKLYESGKAVVTNTASLLFDPNAVDVSGNAYTSEEALIPAAGSVAGEAVERPAAGGVQSSIAAVAPPRTRAVVGSPAQGAVQGVTFSRTSDSNYDNNYWREWLRIAGSDGSKEVSNAPGWSGDTGTLNYNNNEVRLASETRKRVDLNIEHMAQLFQRIELNTYYDYNNVGIGSDQVYGQLTIRRPDGSAVHTGGGYDTNGYQNHTWNFSAGESINAVRMELIESDGMSWASNEEAVCTIRSGYLPRRFFNNKTFNIAVHSGNDAANAGEGETVYPVEFDGEVKIVENNGGVSPSGNLYVGSQLRVTPDASGIGSYRIWGVPGGVYLTGASNNSWAHDGTNVSHTSGDLTMVWDGFIDNSPNDTYTINLVYERAQDGKVDISRSVIKDEGETDEQAQDDAIEHFKESVAGGKITYGYKNYNHSEKSFYDKEGSFDVSNVNSLQTLIINPLLYEYDTQWVNFNLPEEDRIVFNGKSYNGNEKIYIEASAFSLKTMNFLIYDAEAIAIEREAQVVIDSVQVYIDVDNDNEVEGYLYSTDGESGFTLTGNDVFFAEIDMNTDHSESIFAPIELEGMTYKKIMKVFYTVIPRNIEVGSNEGVTGQILPGFLYRVTGDTAKAKLTDEQLELRYIVPAEGTVRENDAKNYLSENIPIYGTAGTALSMIDFPMGGDVSPYTTTTGSDEKSKYEWTPDFEGNLLFEYANPETITLADTIVGNKALEGEELINGYLGSFAGSNKFALAIRKQSDGETMEDLINLGDGGGFTANLDSVTEGGQGTFQNKEGLAPKSTEEAPNGGMDSGGGDTPEGFGVDIGIDLPELSLEDFGAYAGMSFFMEGNRIGFTVGTPTWGESLDAANPVGQNFGENWKSPQKKFNEGRDALGKEGTPGQFGGAQGLTTQEFGANLEVGFMMAWEYDPVQDSFIFSESVVSLTGNVSFSLQFRFTVCPLVYVFISFGASVSVSTGMGGEYVEDEKTNYTEMFDGYNADSTNFGNSLGTSETLSKDATAWFETASDEKALNFYFTGEIEVTFYGLNGSEYQPIRTGSLSSNVTGEPEAVHIDTSIRSILDNEEYVVKVTALENSNIHSIRGVTRYEHILYWKGVTVAPEIFMEVGIGAGIPMAKIEGFIKVVVGAEFIFGAYEGYWEGRRHYDGAQINSFDFSAGLSIRIVALLFTFERSLLEFYVSYEDDGDGEYDTDDWDRGWRSQIANHDTGTRSLRAAADSSGGIQPPQSSAYTQRLHPAATAESLQNSVSGFNLMATRNGGGEAPFELSRYSANRKASALAANMGLGYGYELVTVGPRNFVVYNISRTGPVNGVDASMLVMSELIEGVDGAYGIANPAPDPENPDQAPYIPVDDDGTGDTDFDVYADGTGITVTWVDYKNESDESEAVELSDAVRNTQLKRAVFNIESGSFGSSKVISVSGDSVLTSSTLGDVTAYVAPDLYTDEEYNEAYGEYTNHIRDNYSFGDDADAAQKMTEIMTNTWAIRAQTEGESGVIKLAYGDGSTATTAAIALELGFRPVGVEMIESEGKYLLSYLAEANKYEGNEYVTYKRLYLTSFDPVNPDAAPVSRIIKTVVDYDLSTGSDGEIKADTTVQSDDPILGYPRFIKGKLTNGEDVDPQTLLLYDFNGNTDMIDEAGIRNILNDPDPLPFTATKLFVTPEGHASDRVEANIGVDGAGNVSVVYVSTVKGTTNNALFVSKYSADNNAGAGGFDAGRILAMNHLNVYEDYFGDVGKDWSEEDLEKAYYGELDGYDGGGLTDFKFSNLQVAYGKLKEGGANGSLLILASGSLSNLIDVSADDGETVTKSVQTGNDGVKTGVYALSFDVGASAIGNQEIAFFQEDFSAESFLSAKLAFQNTGDTAFRAAETNPATVSLYADDKSGAPMLIESWKINKTVMPGEFVRVEMPAAKWLEKTLPAGTEFYADIIENENNSDRRHATTAGTGYTIGNTVELALDGFKAHVLEVKGDEVVLGVEFTAKNSGGKASETTFVQFSYLKTPASEGTVPGTEGDYGQDDVYMPLNITGHTLKTGAEELLVLMRSVTASDPVNGIYELKDESGAGGLRNGYSRSVSGTITVSKDVFNTLSEGSFRLRAELFDGADAETDFDGIVSGNTGEHFPLDNFSTLSVVPRTFFDAANNIAVSMGSIYKLPMGATTTKYATKITVGELPMAGTETPPVLGQLYYDTLGFVNVMGRAEGSGIIRVEDESTNSSKSVVFRMGEEGQGTNIYRDNGIFTFYNRPTDGSGDGSPYDPDSPSDWIFRDSVMEWGTVNPVNPLRGDISVSKQGGYVEFDTFANEIELSFIGDVTVSSPGYPEFAGGKTYSSNDLSVNKTITFSSEQRYSKHTVRITANTNDTALDRLFEHYAGTTPLPPSAKAGPTILWSRNVAEKGSLPESGKFEISAYIYDVTGVARVLMNNTEVSAGEVEKLSDELWKVNFTLDENGFYVLSAANMGGLTSNDAITLEAFASAVDQEAEASAPPLAVSYEDEEGNPVTSPTGDDVYMNVNEDAGDTPPLVTEVYRLQDNDSQDRGYTEITQMVEDGKVQLTSNGYYRVMVRDLADDTWSQTVVSMNYRDSVMPGVTFGEETGSAVEGAGENERHLFYYASKASADVQSIGQVTISKITINGAELDITPERTVYGYQPILYGGVYTLAAEDDAGNISTADTTISNFKLYPQEGAIGLNTPASSPTGAGGSLAVDLSKITGGNYDSSYGSNLNDLRGSYSAAVATAGAVEAPEIGGDYGTPAAKQYFESLNWSDSGPAVQFENLAVGEYVLYLRDATDESFDRNITIAAFEFAIKSPPSVVTAALANGKAGVTYSETLTAGGGGTMTWSLAGGNLPDGLTLSPEGTISGMPTAEGTFTFTVKASNGLNPDAEKELSIVVAAADSAPFITTAALANGKAGAAYSETLAAAGTGTMTWSLASGNLPDGLTLSPGGVISGTPTASGTFTFTVKASNGLNPDAEKELSIVIAAADSTGGAGKGGGSSAATPAKPPVSTETSANGVITAGPVNPKSGDTVTVTVQPDEGYEVEGITVTDVNGKELTVTGREDGSYTFIYGGVPVTIEAELVPLSGALSWSNPFKDVAESAWYYEDMAYVNQNGLMNGTAADSFSPNAVITRGMIVTILYRHAGAPNAGNLSNTFSDVTDGTWYADAVKWAAENGIVNGIGEGKYAPDMPVTRQDFAVILMRYMNSMEISPAVTQQYILFADEAEIANYAKDAIQTLNKLEIINGVGGNTIDPTGNATRAQTAAMLHRFVESIE